MNCLYFCRKNQQKPRRLRKTKTVLPPSLKMLVMRKPTMKKLKVKMRNMEMKEVGTLTSIQVHSAHESSANESQWHKLIHCYFATDIPYGEEDDLEGEDDEDDLEGGSYFPAFSVRKSKNRNSTNLNSQY